MTSCIRGMTDEYIYHHEMKVETYNVMIIYIFCFISLILRIFENHERQYLLTI